MSVVGSSVNICNMWMCTVWGRPACIHHHHQLIWHRTQSWRSFQVVSTLR